MLRNLGLTTFFPLYCPLWLKISCAWVPKVELGSLWLVRPFLALRRNQVGQYIIWSGYVSLPKNCNSIMFRICSHFLGIFGGFYTNRLFSSDGPNVFPTDSSQEGLGLAGRRRRWPIYCQLRSFIIGKAWKFRF